MLHVNWSEGRPINKRRHATSSIPTLPQRTKVLPPKYRIFTGKDPTLNKSGTDPFDFRIFKGDSELRNGKVRNADGLTYEKIKQDKKKNQNDAPIVNMSVKKSARPMSSTMRNAKRFAAGFRSPKHFQQEPEQLNEVLQVSKSRRQRRPESVATSRIHMLYYQHEKKSDGNSSRKSSSDSSNMSDLDTKILKPLSTNVNTDSLKRVSVCGELVTLGPLCAWTNKNDAVEDQEDVQLLSQDREPESFEYESSESDTDSSDSDCTD